MTDRYGQTRVVEIRAAIDDLRKACRNEGTPAVQDAWDRLEPWLGYVQAEGVKRSNDHQ